ncbi:MAG: hypothetical protein NC217_08515 [Muribaculaceae bacterium]|nr:hypothetical protein [Muribaculaceae bacterium]
MKYMSIILIVLLSAFISWGIFEITQSAEIQISLGVIAFICALVPPMVAVLAQQSEYPRSNIVIKSTSSVMFVLYLIINGLFAFLGTSIKPIIMVDGILMILYLFAVLKVYKSKQ